MTHVNNFWARLLERKTPTSIPRTIARILLGLTLMAAGAGHLTVGRKEFQAQVPGFLPLDPDFVVVASGIVEVVLGAALVAVPSRRVIVGWIGAFFFIAVFPGNIAQWLDARDGFGLDTDAKRLGRLFFQPVLVLITLWATGAWRERPRLHRRNAS